MKANYYVENGTLAEFKEAVRQVLHGQPTFHWPLEFPEVFMRKGGCSTGSVSDRVTADASNAERPVAHAPGTASSARGGFDAFVCNPPFIGGQKITGNLGVSYRNFLVDQLANGKKGSADLCAYFFLQAKRLLRTGGGFGMLATNTIAQGDTREVGLDQMAAAGGVIYRAMPSRPWPGEASLEVAEVWLRNGGEWRGKCFLEEQPVTGITPFLTKPGRATGKPYRLAANEDKSFIGSYVLGLGFVLTPEEAQALIAKDKRNRDVVFPYLNGEDLNSRPDQSPSRWVINFFDWPLERASCKEWNTADDEKREAFVKAGHVAPDYNGSVAADYPDCLKIVREKVKPERDKVSREIRRRRWWQFAERALALYETIAAMEKMLAIALTSKTLSPHFVSTSQVLDQTVVTIALDKFGCFPLIASSLHYWWVIKYGASLRLDARYTPSDCFETFPFPEDMSSLEKIGEQYHVHRQSIMLVRQEGLTKIYNRFHNPEETAADIERLRTLHQEMDEAVARAYDWTDLRLDHDFHETKQGVRFTLSEAARREVLDRLLELNHRRYAEEVAAGLHEKGAKKTTKGGTAKKSGRAARTTKATLSLFGEGEDEAASHQQRLPEMSRTPQLRRSGMFIDEADTTSASSVGATSECRSYGAEDDDEADSYKHSAPLGLKSEDDDEADSYKHSAPLGLKSEDDDEADSYKHSAPLGLKSEDDDEADSYKHSAPLGLKTAAPAEGDDEAGGYKHPAPLGLKTATPAPRASQSAEDYARPTPIGELETNRVMAAFRQALRGRGWLTRDELLKEVSLALGYQRLRAETEEVLRNHLRAAIRRRIVSADGADLVGPATQTMEDYSLEELREVFASVMRLGRRCEREEVIRAVAEHLGFSRVSETTRQALKSAFNSGIRQGRLGYEGDLIWREE
jgi:hypothetical protein